MQIGNFLLTYLLLKKLFFEKVIDSIKQKEKADKDFLQKIEHEEAILINLAKDKTQNLQDFQQCVTKRTAAISKKQVHLQPHEILSDDISDQELDDLQQKTIETIIKKAPSDY